MDCISMYLFQQIINPKYGTYTLMDDGTGKVVAFSVI